METKNKKNIKIFDLVTFSQTISSNFQKKNYLKPFFELIVMRENGFSKKVSKKVETNEIGVHFGVTKCCYLISPVLTTF